ncbi:M48 family metallopeptidase [Qipengyuania gelatinilytica]|uniref:M48 family metallopeptidase n=1 Tax=Qipengyuania gelatinilytica TaxID=2867231 RepID=A0ABX9A1H0_9SPHN|nr:M48 family metallopeptidase [Qipengyuania gelatinilytica]QZD94019.1 M48 family metallopeptidase [Qipengyuania gelatinilytica]
MEQSFRTPAQWYDGHNAIRHEGEAVWDGGGSLHLRSFSSEMDVALDDLEYRDHRGGELVYTSKEAPDFRLIVPEDLPPGLAAKLPGKQVYGGWIDKVGLGKASAAFAAVSLAAVALFLTAPEWLGPRVPESWERNLGQAMVGDLGNRLCHTPEGDAALAKLLDAVDLASMQVRAGVANMDMVNAVALPGGQVLLFDGLVQDAETPEELAGVLGHEVGHVRERHVMTALLRQFGLSILLSGANSGLGDTVFGLASMSYSRDAEREADEFARKRMEESNVSPLGAARFFERIGGDSEAEDNSLVGWVASHPAPRERADAFRKAAEGKTFSPVLTAQEFEALKSMCEDDPDVEEFDFLF